MSALHNRYQNRIRFASNCVSRPSSTRQSPENGTQPSAVPSEKLLAYSKLPFINFNGRSQFRFYRRQFKGETVVQDLNAEIVEFRWTIDRE